MPAVEWVILIAVALVTLSIFLSVFLLGVKKRALERTMELTIPDDLPTAGVDIPVVEACAGIKGLGALTLAQNRLSPGFLLFEDHLEYKVFFRRSARYSDIEEVKGVSQRYFNRMRFIFRARTLTLTIFLFSMREYSVLADFLRRKGIAVQTKN